MHSAVSDAAAYREDMGLRPEPRQAETRWLSMVYGIWPTPDGVKPGPYSAGVPRPGSGEVIG